MKPTAPLRATTAAAALLAAFALAPAPASAAAPTNRFYETSTVSLPLTSNQVARLGRDQNGDGRPDNKLGQAVSFLASQGFDLTPFFQAPITDGSVSITHKLRATSFFRGPATWRVSVRDVDGPALKGTIAQRRGTFGPGSIPLPLALGGSTAGATLSNAKVAATCTATACTGGKVTGALTQTEIDDHLLPAVAAFVQQIVDADCPGGSCEPDSDGADLLNLLDEDDDGQVSAAEVAANTLVGPLLAPDLDLLKADGKPGKDGVKDSLSFGFGFTAERAPA